MNKTIPWNKGLRGIYSEETKRKISEKMTGRALSLQHKKRIARSQKKRIASIKQCCACSVKSKWIYKVIIPSVSEYTLLLCDIDLIEQFHSLSSEDKRKVSILA